MVPHIQKKKERYAPIVTNMSRPLVLEEQPENLDVMMSLATVYEEQGNEDAAMEIVEFGKLDTCLNNRTLIYIQS
jgi:hypothetical protein